MIQDTLWIKALQRRQRYKAASVVALAKTVTFYKRKSSERDDSEQQKFTTDDGKRCRNEALRAREEGHELEEQSVPEQAVSSQGASDVVEKADDPSDAVLHQLLIALLDPVHPSSFESIRMKSKHL